MDNEYISRTHYRQILEKAKVYKETVRARQAIYQYDGFDGILEMRKLNELQYGDIMTLAHLMSIICYTDYSELCTAWTASFRQTFIGESQKSMEHRQKSYYYLSKYLYQVVNYFGVACHGEWQVVKQNLGHSESIYISWAEDIGPFYCGMNQSMPFPSFSIKLNSPTSTSREQTVAARFADETGILIQFNNNGLLMNDRTSFFDSKWISKFSEEEEVYVTSVFVYVFFFLYFYDINIYIVFFLGVHLMYG